MMPSHVQVVRVLAGMLLWVVGIAAAAPRALAAPQAMATPATAPSPLRVAVWDPQFGTEERYFTVDRALLDQAAGWLREAKIDVQRLTARQLESPDSLSAGQFDALVMDGRTFPRPAAPALLRFLDEGGVLVALDSTVPFLIGIEPNAAHSAWTVSPSEPKFAWESKQILDALGLQYVYAPPLHDQAANYTATPLLKRYLPDAPDPGRGKLPSRWLVPIHTRTVNGEYYPLIRSRRFDGVEAMPLVYVVRNGVRTAIVSGNRLFTDGSQPKVFPGGAAMVVAMARLAGDLHRGAIALNAADRVELARDPGPPAPLTSRVPPRHPVDPEGARALARWGQFDGLGIELGEPLSQTLEIGPETGQEPSRLPRALLPGAVLTLQLPELGQGPRYVRIRGAYDRPGAALSVRLDKMAVWGEAFTYVDAKGKGNFQAADLGGTPTEFDRIIYLPPQDQDKATALAVSNPGKAAVWFDAIQVEQRTAPARTMLMGLGGGFATGITGQHNPIPRELSRTWSTLRSSGRLNYLGAPDDPRRWEKVDRIFHQQEDVNPRLEVIIEGTPPWAAISPQRLAEGEKVGRSRTVPPDNNKYATIVEQFIERYGQSIDAYEIWNEPNIQQFWRGTPEEFAAMYLRVAALVRKLDPSARIIAPGMAGVNPSFLQCMVDSGAMAMADLIAIHPYAGKSVGWDIVCAQFEGEMLSHGIGTEIYSNESGFPYKNIEWFTPPPLLTPRLQAQMLNTALARLMQNGIAKVNVFNAGGDAYPYGLFDQSGKPRPAYAVFADYLKLAENEGRRLDVAMTSSDGAPLAGVYVAAATHADGSVTAVVNPAEVASLQPSAEPTNPSTDFSDLSGWHSFYGTAKAAGGLVTLTPDAGKPYVGFNGSGWMDLKRWPLLELNVPEAAGDVQLEIKHDGQSAMVFQKVGKGIHRADLRPLMALDQPTHVEFTIRATGVTQIDALRFQPDPAHAPPPPAPWSPKPVPVVLSLPVVRGPTEVRAAQQGQPGQVLPFELHQSNGQLWVRTTVPLTGRTVVSVR
jgi:hypothetical protein